MAVVLTILALAGCTQPPRTIQAAPSSKVVQSDWAQASLDLDGVGFDCARATDTPEVLRATVGPGVTHAQVLAQCLRRLLDASSDVQLYDRAVVGARDLKLANRDQLHALTGQLASFLERARSAAEADDMPALLRLREDIATAEGQLLAAGVNGSSGS